MLFVVLAGCSDKVKLGGKISFPDGEPLTVGTVIFSNPEYLARSSIAADGSYDVGSLKENDGLPPGKYRVYITGAIKTTGKRPVTFALEGGGTKEAEEDILELMIDPKYTHRDTTPLTVEIPGINVYNFTVERP